ncbi:MAG: NAD-dependent epimerase/dehydratase family protein [Candidatus Aenigmarchaeota archaeon]|nr:NAD-dependent epimerase/dehydratase family protein [Candidatus Aenigmarchaeota archaeon]
MKILITGGAGFIGSSLANHLCKEHEVTVVDSLFLGDQKNLDKKVTFIKEDVRNPNGLENIFSKKFDYVFHLAAISSAPMYLDGKEPDPRVWVDVNIGGFTNVIELCRKTGVKKLVYASTSSIYSGNPLPFSESQKITPKTFYETTLYCREFIADTYMRMHGFPSVGLRYFAVYGYNERHKGVYANLISQFLWDMLENKPPVIYGDGSQTRDFTFISDIVDATILAMKTDMNGVYNVGTGKNYTAGELIKIMNHVIGKDIKPKYITNPLKNYVANTLADITKIKAYGFRPKISLEEGIRLLYKFYTEK